MTLLNLATLYVGTTISFAFAAMVFFGLLILPLYAGYFYSLPNLILKTVGSSAVRRI